MPVEGSTGSATHDGRGRICKYGRAIYNSDLMISWGCMHVSCESSWNPSHPSPYSYNVYLVWMVGKSFIHTHICMYVYLMLSIPFSLLLLPFTEVANFYFKAKRKSKIQKYICIHIKVEQQNALCIMFVLSINTHTHLPRRKIIRTDTFYLCQVAANRLHLLENQQYQSYINITS